MPVRPYSCPISLSIDASAPFPPSAFLCRGTRLLSMALSVSASGELQACCGSAGTRVVAACLYGGSLFKMQRLLQGLQTSRQEHRQDHHAATAASGRYNRQRDLTIFDLLLTPECRFRVCFFFSFEICFLEEWKSTYSLLARHTNYGSPI